MSFTGELPTIECKYSCAQCGLHRVAVNVPIRTTQDVAEWMERVCIFVIAADHAARSPECTALSMQDVMIPVSGADKVGGPKLT